MFLCRVVLCRVHPAHCMMRVTRRVSLAHISQSLQLTCTRNHKPPTKHAEQRVLPCFHRFHVACIDAWLQRKKLCPLCNTSIEVILSPDLGVTA